MDTVINAIPSGTLASAGRQRVGGSSPASEQREARVTAARTDQVNRKPEARARDKDVKRAADRLNEALQGLNRDLAISVHGDPGVLMVEVTDPATGDVIRQIPPEQLLEVEGSIDKIIGLFVNDTA